ncbi:hypothetical protein AJ78_06603 [Emergomyces pasteurianus Ep9510]|uniref:Retrotransposon gag domain-containing protein n=1 Tax=Emergomyces pasteurianus Ep9510 TaxID=1447872 RepID=A0A1J9PY94_9EURO|nr:hypothetical protein AJ78_06603 [Emergomyces pasteurianus Ep9510]
MASVRPTFSLCEKLSGEKGQSSSRWLLKLEWELRGSKVNGAIPAEEVLPAIIILLTGEAEKWIQEKPLLARLLDNPTEDNNTTFLEAFKNQFSEQSTKDKTLRRFGIKDQIATSVAMRRKPEILLPEAVIDKWVRGLVKTRTRIKLIKVSDELSTLSSAYHKAMNFEKAE